MDKTLKIKIADFNKALLTLEEALKARKNKFVRDAAIKRFEYCFELGWKTAKLFLINIYGIDTYSPKAVWRELARNEIFTEKETEKALAMTNDRNEIIHTYNDKFAEELYRRIATKHFALLRKTFLCIVAKTSQDEKK